LPNLLWNAAHSFVSYAHTEDNVNLSGDLFRFDTLFEFIGAQFGVFGPILFALLIIVLVHWRGWRHDRRKLLLVCFTLPTLALMIGQAFLSRANANWAAPVYVAGSVLVTVWVLNGLRADASLWRGRALWLSGSVVLHLGAMSTVVWLARGRRAPGIVVAATLLVVFHLAGGGLDQPGRLIALIVVANGAIGLVLGWIYAAYGFELVMLGHAVAHVITVAGAR